MSAIEVPKQNRCSGHIVLDEEAVDKPQGGFQVIVNYFIFCKIQDYYNTSFKTDSNVQATLYLMKRL